MQIIAAMKEAETLIKCQGLNVIGLKGQLQKIFYPRFFSSINPT
jgi:hypothetical protein